MMFLSTDISNPRSETPIEYVAAFEQKVASTRKENIKILTKWIYEDDSLTKTVNYKSTFLNEYFQTQKSFDSRQFSLMEVANLLFKGSRALTSEEQKNLNIAFKNSLLDSPTIKGRK